MFPITLSIACATASEAAAVLARLGAPAVEVAGLPLNVEVGKLAAASAGAEPTAQAQAAAAPASKEKASSKPAKPSEDLKAAEPEAPAKKTPTYLESGIPEAIKSYMGTKGSEGYDVRRVAMVGLLKDFGVSKGPELNADQFEAFSAQLKALAEKAQAPEESLG